MAIDWLLATAGPGATRGDRPRRRHRPSDGAAGGTGCNVLALEPNDAMRRHGVARTRPFSTCAGSSGTPRRWPAGGRVLAGDLRLVLRRGGPGGDLPRGGAHPRAARLVRLHVEPSRPRRSAAKEIESFIEQSITEFDYGTRQEDQTAILAESGLFESVRFIRCPVLHRRRSRNGSTLWHSHATLQRQAGARFAAIVEGIAEIVDARCGGRSRCHAYDASGRHGRRAGVMNAACSSRPARSGSPASPPPGNPR